LAKAFTPEFKKSIEAADGALAAKPPQIDEGLSPEDKEVLQALRVHHSQNTLNLQSFTTDVVNGLVPKLERGSLTLVAVDA
jgi:hypothetical protein